MSDTPTENIPVFYVCITATPEGPPIEIAWASLAFETCGVICESRLIQPPAPWSSELARDPAGLQTYGLSLSDLCDFGTPPRELAAHMNDAIADRELFSAELGWTTRASDGLLTPRRWRGIRVAKERRRSAHRRTRAVTAFAARRLGASQTGSRAHVPYRHPRRGKGTLSRDLLGNRHAAEIVARG